MEERLDVLFLSMHYRPEPCDTRTSQLARAFAVRGHKATVLTSFPNYPFGKIYPGYRQKIVQKDTVDGVEVVRVPMYPDHSKRKLRRALSYLSFLSSALTIGSWATKRPDLIWVHQPPPTTGLAGWLLARLKRVPFVYEIHDLWPETLVSTGMASEGRMTRALSKLCGFLYKRASAIVVTSPGMKRHLEAQGVTGEKIHILPQWADEQNLTELERQPEFGVRHGLEGRFNVFFTGNIGAAQSLDFLLYAAKLLKDTPEIQIVLVGRGVEADRLRRRAMLEELSNVRFVDQVPRDQMRFVFAWADALFLHLAHDPLFAITVPSKLQTYLAVGRPVLCGVAGDAAEIVKEAQAGYTFPPEAAHGIAEAIQRMYDLDRDSRETLGENGRRFYENKFSQGALVPKYEKLFVSVLKGPITLELVEGGQPVARSATDEGYPEAA